MKQRFLHVWHGTDRNIIDNAIDEWRGRRACVGAKGRRFERLLWQYSATWQETFQFLSDVSRYLDCFFLDFTTISYFWLSQYWRCVVLGSIIWVLLEIFLAFQQWKNFENPLRIDKVIDMSLVCSCFRPACISHLYSMPHRGSPSEFHKDV